ncbi:MAG TPA: COX15/CtaA family protein [Hyphomonadaceae bacterium]|nr:COX15/CtaA family protein [Hyphomonadaceae bacterium]
MSEAVAPARRPFLQEAVSPRVMPWMRLWLLAIAVMVYFMILVGGATRLTDSGLSITEWKPLLGSIPPMNEADWQSAFAKYQSMTAQYHELNPNMDLGGFKGIYWWEWSHRELGRAIGVVFFVPFVVFLALRGVSRKIFPHLAALFILGGLQGLIGWWMVSSGVETDLTSVAPYRLMTHFCLALFIICYSFWLWLDLGAMRRPMPDKAKGWTTALIWIAGLQMALGALVAGLDAGRGYTDWPLMAGQFVPKLMWDLDPWWRNFVENGATVQFLHRLGAYTLFAVAIAGAIRFRKEHWSLFIFAAGLVTLQALLGITTLMHGAPVDLSLTHQALGVIVLLAMTRLVWTSRAR